MVPPHRGRGLNSGLQDAAIIVGQLDGVKKGDEGLKDGLVTYEEVKKRAMEEIPLSIAQEWRIILRI